MYTGIIARLTDRGFGFIEAKDVSDSDIFFHASGLKGAEYNDLRQGDRMNFDTEQGPNGLRAINVERATEAAAE